MKEGSCIRATSQERKDGPAEEGLAQNGKGVLVDVVLWASWTGNTGLLHTYCVAYDRDLLVIYIPFG